MPPRAQKCGVCRSCLNPHWKQACQAGKLKYESTNPLAQSDDEQGSGGEQPATEPQRRGRGRPPAQRQQQQQHEAGGSEGVSGRENSHDKRLLLFNTNYSHARHQHLSNLVFLLRQCAASRDWQRLAGVVATLMASDRAENVSEKWMYRHPESRARLAEALGAGWLLLQQRHPTALSYVQTGKYLKQWAAFQMVPAGREAVLLELARYSRAQGHATDAWDLLNTQHFTTLDTEAQRLGLMATIRIDTWAEVMRVAAVPPAGAAQLGSSSSPNKRRRGGPTRPGGGWQPWQHDAHVWARGGRVGKEIHQEAVECCLNALQQEPGSSQVARQLAQLQLAAGDAKAAVETARRVHRAAPQDADAVGLLSLLLVAAPAQQAAQHAQHAGGAENDEEEEEEVERAGGQQRGPSAASPGLVAAADAEAADCCRQLLSIDPSCQPAAAALLALHGRHPLPALLLTAACCCYLEARPPTWLPCLLELRAWQHLAATLVGVSASVVACSKRLKELQQQRQPLVPRSLREVRRLRRAQREGGGNTSKRQQQEVGGMHGGQQQQREGGGNTSEGQQQQEGGGGTDVQQRWRSLAELGEAVVRAQQELGQALEVHRQCAEHMEGRLWWRDAHLLPQPAAAVATALQQGAASPAALLAQAAVHAFLHPLWQQRVVADWRASGGTAGLPRLLQNLMTRHTAAALQKAGHQAEAGALRKASKLCRKACVAAEAAAEAAEGTGVVAALASVARQRADFWRAAGKPWKPPSGWLPIPPGTSQPQLGRVAALPSQWWATFPQYRHRQQPPPAVPAVPVHQQQQQQQPAAASPEGTAALTPQHAAANHSVGQADRQPSSQQAQQAQQAQVGRRQAQALRRVQPAGMRSILKGSQPPMELEDGEWHGTQASQPAAAVPLLVGSDPSSVRAGGRRVQFQLPAEEGEEGEEGEQGEAAEEREGEEEGEVAPMDEDGGVTGSQGEEHDPSAAAAAAAAAGATTEATAAEAAGSRRRVSTGKRRLLPQLPPSLSQEEGEGDGEGAAGDSGGASWKQRLQRHRKAHSQQK